MSFYLLCSIILCIRASSSLHSQGKKWKEHRNEISIEEAHDVNKNYLANASDTLLTVRTNQWYF